MTWSWVLILLPVYAGDGQTQVPYSFQNQASCAKVAAELFPERRFRCVAQLPMTQFATINVKAALADEQG